MTLVTLGLIFQLAGIPIPSCLREYPRVWHGEGNERVSAELSCVAGSRDPQWGHGGLQK